MMVAAEKLLDEILRQIPQPPRCDMADAMFYGFSGMRVYTDAEAMSDTYIETMKFPGHPITKWLARWFNFDPDVTAQFIRKRAKREAYRFGDSLVMHPVAAREFFRVVDTSTA